MKVRLPQGHPLSMLALLTFTACLLLSGNAIAQEDADDERLSDLLVHTKNGPIQGIIKKSRNDSIEFLSFVGLRYADIPARFEVHLMIK